MFTVVIPRWEYYFVKAKKTKAKYWLWAHREKLPKKYKEILHIRPLVLRGKEYCQNKNGLGERFVKNTTKVGKENIWVLNGQDLYNAKLDWRQRKKVAEYYHKYFAEFIKAQLSPIDFTGGKTVSVSCDIYEIKRSPMPDASNMWLLEKFFEDALQECGIIPDDNPDYVRESGRKRYHWVDTPEKRALIFTIKYL